MRSHGATAIPALAAAIEAEVEVVVGKINPKHRRWSSLLRPVYANKSAERLRDSSPIARSMRATAGQQQGEATARPGGAGDRGHQTRGSQVAGNGQVLAAWIQKGGGGERVGGRKCIVWFGWRPRRAGHGEFLRVRQKVSYRARASSSRGLQV